MVAESTSQSSKVQISVKDLLDAGLHFGHQTKRWNPKMKRYIFDKRNGIHIVDLTKSAVMLQQALGFVRDVVLSGKNILFVGTKKQAQEIVKEAAVDCGQHYVTYRWLGGTLTNSPTIRRSVDCMQKLETQQKTDNFAAMPKQEASRARRELQKLQRNLQGVAAMKDLPGLVFVVDVSREAIAVKEANRLKVPVVAIVDTNCDPDPIDYIIPGNDDALRAIKLIVDAVAGTAKAAAAEYAKIAAEQTRKREAARAAAEAERAVAIKEAAAARDAAAVARRDAGDAKGPRRAGADRKTSALSGTKAAGYIQEDDVAADEPIETTPPAAAAEAAAAEAPAPAAPEAPAAEAKPEAKADAKKPVRRRKTEAKPEAKADATPA